MMRDRDEEFAARVPPWRARVDLDADVAHVGRFAEWRATPAVVARIEGRREAQTGERGERRDGDERRAALACSAREAHGFVAFGLNAREHDEREAARAQQLLGGAKRVAMRLGSE